MPRYKITGFILTIFCLSALSFQAHAQQESHNISLLPLGLNFDMSKKQVSEHLKAFEQYKIASNKDDVNAYAIPADFGAKNALFLYFSSHDKLTRLKSAKHGMDCSNHDSYLEVMLAASKEWKLKGAKTIIESSENAFYQYQLDNLVLTINGTPKKSRDAKCDIELVIINSLDKDNQKWILPPTKQAGANSQFFALEDFNRNWIELGGTKVISELNSAQYHSANPSKHYLRYDKISIPSEEDFLYLV